MRISSSVIYLLLRADNCFVMKSAESGKKESESVIGSTVPFDVDALIGTTGAAPTDEWYEIHPEQVPVFWHIAQYFAGLVLSQFRLHIKLRFISAV